TDATKSASHATDAATDATKSASHATDAATDATKSASHATDAAADGAKGADDAADAAGDAADGARGADDAADAAADGSRGADGAADGPSFDERHRPEVFGDPVEVKKGDDLYPGKNTPFAQKPDITLEPNTHYRVERPGGVHSDYYTDASGNVTHVECHSKWETGYLNQDLQHPLPNATYSVDGKFHYVTDEHARTVRMEVDGEMTPKPKDVDDVRSPHTQRQVNAYGNDLPGEHNGGHMAGTQFYGPPEKINVVAMLKEVNQNFPDSGFESYHVLESKIADNPGNYQNFAVDFDYRDSVGPELTNTERVPTNFEATWTDASGADQSLPFVNHH
ncbi:DNA/RNA non-specific endonuclease, partial [Actinomyces oris]